MKEVPFYLLSFYRRNKLTVWAAVLAAYIVPTSLYYFHNYGLEGSWKRAINLAIRDNRVFGSEFMFSYGPLGFLSTRNNEYINPWIIVLGDLLLAAGFFNFYRRCLAKDKSYFWVLLAATLFARGAEYTQLFFFIFAISALLLVRDESKNYFLALFCGISGVVIFFIKINYGLIALGLLALLLVFALFRHIRSFAILLVSGISTFVTIYAYSNIDVAEYIRSSGRFIQYYDEAMMRPISFADPVFLLAMAVIVLLLGIAASICVSALKQKRISFHRLVAMGALTFLLFLFYKNGFTRADVIHYGAFFAITPLFSIAFVFLLDGKPVRNVALVSIAVSSAAFLYVQTRDKTSSIKHTLSYLAPAYLSQLMKSGHPESGSVLLTPDAVAHIGRRSIDLIPAELALLQVNGLNYNPRPIPQSYGATEKTLDSINAAHFLKAARPQLIMMRNESIDNHYAFWDESLTKATIKVNYAYDQTVSPEKDTMTKYLLLASVTSVPARPIFRMLEKRRIHFGDTVRFSYPGTEAIYLRAQLSYTPAALLRKRLFQPPPASITLLLDDGSAITIPAIPSELKIPCLINKTVSDLAELKNFFTNNLAANKSVTGLVFNAPVGGFQQGIDILFEQFENYRVP